MELIENSRKQPNSSKLAKRDYGREQDLRAKSGNYQIGVSVWQINPAVERDFAHVEFPCNSVFLLFLRVSEFLSFKIPFVSK